MQGKRRTLVPGGAATLEPGDDRLAAYDRARGALLADYQRLTRFVLALSRSPRLARGSLRLFAAFPALFRHLVGVAGGAHPLLPG